MSTFLAFLAVGAFAAMVHRWTATRSSRGIFHLDQFRPAAPLAGFLPTNHEEARVYADLSAMYAHQDESEHTAA